MDSSFSKSSHLLGTYRVPGTILHFLFVSLQEACRELSDFLTKTDDGDVTEQLGDFPKSSHSQGWSSRSKLCCLLS